MNIPYKIIKTIDEISEEDILQRTKFTTITRKHKYFQIDKDKEGYCIYGYICGDMPTFVCKSNYVTYWKTLNGLKRAIKRFADKGYWGFQIWFPNKEEII